MKREILFRGKREDNGEWVYGYLTPNNQATYNSMDNDFVINTGIIDCYKVITDTIGQFIGLTDTKNNNRKIFEGDIYKSGKLIGVVEWNNTLSQFQLTWQNMPTAADIYSMINLNYIFEYAGTIYDNPELVK